MPEVPDELDTRVGSTAYELLTSQQRTLLHQALEDKHSDFPVEIIGREYPRRRLVKTWYRDNHSEDGSVPPTVSIFAAKDGNGRIWTRIAVPRSGEANG